MSSSAAGREASAPRSGAPSAVNHCGWVIETLRYEAPDEHRTFVIENQRKFLQTTAPNRGADDGAPERRTADRAPGPGAAAAPRRAGTGAGPRARSRRGTHHDAEEAIGARVHRAVARCHA